MGLKDFQIDLYNSAEESIDSGNRAVAIISPTGTGKSYIMGEFNANYEDTVNLVHRTELLQQISLSLCMRDIPHNIIGQDSTIKHILKIQNKMFGKTFYDYNAPHTVGSLDTLLSRYDKHQKLFKSTKRLIIDEANHVTQKNKWGKAVQLFNPEAKIIGLTATPRRLGGEGLGSHADGIFDDMVVGPGIRWHIDQGNLCDYKVIIPKSDLEKFLRMPKGQGTDFKTGDLRDAFKESRLVGNIIEEWFKHAWGKQTLIFAPDIQSGHEIEEAFKFYNVDALMLSSKTKDRERFEGIQRFKEKDLRVVINVALFDEGLDISGVECVTHARSTLSLSRYLQTNGRGLRADKDNPNKILTIIDHTQNTLRHRGVCTNRQWTLDRYKKPKAPTEYALTVCLSCARPYLRTHKACPFCSEPKAPGESSRITPEMVDGDLTLVDAETLQKLMLGANQIDDAQKVQEKTWYKTKSLRFVARNKKMRDKRLALRDELFKVMKSWGEGYSEKQRDVNFFLQFNMTKYEALALNQSRDLIALTEKIKQQLQQRGNNNGRIQHGYQPTDR